MSLFSVFFVRSFDWTPPEISPTLFLPLVAGANIIFLTVIGRGKWGEWISVVSGFAVLATFARGWDFVFLLAPVFSFCVLLFSSRILSILFVSISLPLFGLWLRFRGLDSIIFWWMFSFWLRFVSLGLSEAPQDSERLGKRFLDQMLFFFAPPFLFGPLSLEWLRYDYFKGSRTVGRISWSLFAKGVLFLVAYEQFFSGQGFLRDFAWSQTNLSEDAGWLKHAVCGYVFFISRYLQIAGLTALAVSIFRAGGFNLKYDFDRPFVAKNFLEFWSRYHSYARDFLATHIFYPFLLRMPPFLPLWLTTFIGILLVFGFVAIVQHMNFVPIAGIDGARFYSLAGCIQHSAVAVVAVLFTILWSKIVDGVLRSISPPQSSVTSVIAKGLKWLMTQIVVGTFFYGAYWNLWMGWSFFEFFIRFIKHPWMN